MSKVKIDPFATYCLFMASSACSSAGALHSLALATHVGEQILRKGVFDLDQRQVQILREELHQQGVAVSSEARPQPAEEKPGLLGGAADLDGFRLGQGQFQRNGLCAAAVTEILTGLA